MSLPKSHDMDKRNEYRTRKAVIEHLKINNRTIFEEYGLIWQKRSTLPKSHRDFVKLEVERQLPTECDPESIVMENEYDPD